MSEWISTDNENLLPKFEEYVLILIDVHRQIAIAYRQPDYVNEYQWRCDLLTQTIFIEKKHVTHWMPLPELPEIK